MNYFNYWLQMLGLCLLHYLLTSDSEAMTLQKWHHSILCFSKLFLLNFSYWSKLVLYWIFSRVIALGLALLYRYYPLTFENIWGHSLMLLLQQFLFLFLFCNWKMLFFNIANSFVRKQVFTLISTPHKTNVTTTP